ncbi:MAG: 4-hydroxythreonine-4-phosphate dehydrogenase PdxA [Acidobacteriota bacterium]
MIPKPPTLALTQGDPAGIGPEIVAKLLADPRNCSGWRALVIAERAAIESLADEILEPIRHRLEYLTNLPTAETLSSLANDCIPVFDPVQERRRVHPGRSQAADAVGAVAAIDAAIDLALSGWVDAVVTAPISKISIARHHLADFRGHTDYLATKCGLSEYGRDYLMAFLTPDLQVALLTTHLPLATAIGDIDSERLLSALSLLQRCAGGRIALAGINPHAGEGGLLGSEDGQILEPAVLEARASGIDVVGPESADSLFARARQGEFDWVLALYHDQGLIAVKTAWFGRSTNWTLGLPFLRTSVDHGTAFDLAGGNRADVRPLQAVIETTLKLLAGELPRRTVGRTP